ncbi:MAG: hypothetical protein ACR2GH_00655 [Pseudonocardia sp.]
MDGGPARTQVDDQAGDGVRVAVIERRGQQQFVHVPVAGHDVDKLGDERCVEVVEQRRAGATPIAAGRRGEPQYHYLKAFCLFRAGFEAAERCQFGSQDSAPQ